MEAYLNKSIKEVIRQFPEVGKILDDYDIGCAPCSVGDCLLKDIVEIHNLSAEDERALLARIARVLYPDREIEIPQSAKKPRKTVREFKYSPPVKKLVDEHKLIKRCIALLPRVLESLDVDSPESRELVVRSVDFIRNYADRYHHAKEEDILFKFFNQNLDILKSMHEEHEKGRAHIRAVLEAVDRRDAAAIKEHLNAYRELLTEHIKKEDEILYPWMDRTFSTTQVGQLYAQFSRVDEQFGDTAEKYSNFIQGLEKRFCGVSAVSP